jgi:integrase
MPRKRLPARLYLRQRESREPRWVIIDGRTEIDTGCGPGDYKQAQDQLGEYIAETREIDTSTRNPAQISCADVIALYSKHHPAAPGCYHAKPLLDFFGLKTLSEINGQLCRDYRAERGKKVVDSTVRRELGTFQAAINFWHLESPLNAVPVITKPAESAPRDRVLTRTEAAKMLNAARKLRLPYVARFILLGLYTGTRHATLLRLRWYETPDAGWIDAERGIIYRAGKAEKQTRKRRGTARLPDRLLAHVRRWARVDLGAGPQTAVIRYKGNPIGRQQRGWEAVVKAAGCEDVTPHVLKHSATTWLLREGVDLFDISALTSTSMKTLETVYGHHNPEFQEATKNAFRRRA